MFTHALKKSFEELLATINSAKTDLNNDELKTDVNFRLGTYLHWMMDCWERIEDNSTTPITQEHKALFSAFRYANNELKHGENLISLYKRTGGVSFPGFSFPMIIESIEFKWAVLDISEKGHANQFKNYQSYLESKLIIDTVIEAKEVAETYNAIS